MRPNDRKYLKTHEWCQIRDGVAKVGITDFAVTSLPKPVFVDMPTPGTWIGCGHACGEIETVGGVYDLISPLGGELLEVNDEVIDNPGALAANPFDNWIVRIKLGGKQLEMLESEAYEQHCAAQSK